MKISSKIITVGISAAWDMICQFESIEWGRHETADLFIERPAGKAMNISHALAWMGEKNIAAGLWGLDDYQQMLKALRPLNKLIKVKMTATAGATRRNITIVDRAKNREMHVRDLSQLASKKALNKLRTELGSIVNKNSICVFAGAMPQGPLLSDVIKIIKFCHRLGAKIVVDTCGEALMQIVNCGKVWLIKPNVEELSELFKKKVVDNPNSLAKAAGKLLDKVEFVLVSRGKKGAIVVGKNGAWSGRFVGAEKKTLSTVSCGDYFLAGFLKGVKDNCNTAGALETAIKIGTARAWGWTEQKSWPGAQRIIKTEIRLL